MVSSQGCQQVQFSSYIYDFNQLLAPNGTYLYTKGNYNYYINICGTSNVCSSQLNGLCNSCMTPLQQTRWDSNGQNDTIKIEPLPNGVLGGSITSYNPNAKCSATQYRTTKLNLFCSSNTTQILNVVESPVCYYTFTITSNLACPLNLPTPSPTLTVAPTPTPTFTVAPTPTPTFTPNPSSNSSVSTSTTTLNQDEITITTTITTRTLLDSYSVTNTTTFTNSIQTTTSTITTIYDNGSQTRDVSTRTVAQGSQVVTKTYDSNEDN